MMTNHFAFICCTLNRKMSKISNNPTHPAAARFVSPFKLAWIAPRPRKTVQQMLCDATQIFFFVCLKQIQLLRMIPMYRSTRIRISHSKYYSLLLIGELIKIYRPRRIDSTFLEKKQRKFLLKVLRPSIVLEPCRGRRHLATLKPFRHFIPMISRRSSEHVSEGSLQDQDAYRACER